jgi:hypothetical protein
MRKVKMLKLAICLTLLLSNCVFGQDLIKKISESSEQFVKRIMPDTLTLAHTVIETGVWDSTGKAIIALYRYDSEDEVSTVLGHVYLKNDSSEYQDITFGPIEGEQNPVEILSLFFANADDDKEKELFVLSTWKTKHYDAEGNVYLTAIYDNPSKDNDELTCMDVLSKTFFGCDCYSQSSGKQTEAKYKNAQSVRAKLKQMGFKQ